MTQEQFHWRVADLEDSGLSHEEAIEQVAWAEDHPAHANLKSGRCTLCEEDATELVPWGQRESLCWQCADYQLDLMARAIQEIVPDGINAVIALGGVAVA